MDKHGNHVNQFNQDDSWFKIPDMDYEVVNRYPHDPEAFTQGLTFLDGTLYESTGSTNNSLSTLRQVEIRTGKILRCLELPAKYFAEGLTIFGKKIFQLSLTDKGFVYDLNTFRLVDTFSYKRERWGLTNDGQYLIMSDGSNQLRLIDPNSFDLVGKPIDVFINGKPLVRLNELEYIKDSIYANVWMTDWICRIDPRDGSVTGRADLSALRPAETKACDECVLNGIAYNEERDHLFVTGKMWPTMFEIRFLTVNRDEPANAHPRAN